jgi:hypothetical protein
MEERFVEIENCRIWFSHIMSNLLFTVFDDREDSLAMSSIGIIGFDNKHFIISKSDEWIRMVTGP